MRVGILSVDGKNDFPNLALMKLSAYHKRRGDTVEALDAMRSYDVAYLSKVFSFTPDYDYPINADAIIYGGTGYNIKCNLPPEIEYIRPDYSLYPNFKPALGFLTRGCIRHCPWCIVPQKEGEIKAWDTWQHIKRKDSNEIVFMDNNILASPHGLAQLEELSQENIRVDFNQGLDARLITPEIAGILCRIKWIRFIRIACDTSEMLPAVERAVSYLLGGGVKTHRIFCYALIRDIDESYDRIMHLRSMGIEPFAQPYRDYTSNTEPTREQRDLARWVNNKAVFRSVPFDEYRGRKQI